jgi:hypothetical protein
MESVSRFEISKTRFIIHVRIKKNLVKITPALGTNYAAKR